MTELKPISKKKFDKLTKAEQRVAIAKDVLARMNAKQLIPRTGDFCHMIQPIKGNLRTEVPLQPIINISINKCEACAKGSLFISFVGINNDYTTEAKTKSVGSIQLNSPEITKLSKIFTLKQLAYIETAFEGYYYDWNVELTNDEKRKCVEYRNKISDGVYSNQDEDAIVITAICNNIIKNKGTFKL